MLLARFGIYLTVVFWFLPFGMACAFLGVQLAVFGVMMGASFAPNHKGMPTIAHDAKVDFFSRQVRTSRNIRGGWWVSFLMGGLNYQVEHHLFPSMPRPALKQARLLVRDHCDTLDVPYTETTLLRSYGIVVRYLNRVGLAARDPSPARWSRSSASTDTTHDAVPGREARHRTGGAPPVRRLRAAASMCSCVDAPLRPRACGGRSAPALSGCAPQRPRRTAFGGQERPEKPVSWGNARLGTGDVTNLGVSPSHP